MKGLVEMNDDEKLKALATDLFSMFSKPKQKKLRPFVNQLTYKGITKKWQEDGNGNFLDYVGKPKIVYDIAKNDNEDIIAFTKRMIDEGTFK